MKHNTGIYQIVNQINGKRYIGSAVDIYGRKRVHFSNLNNNKHENDYLQKSYNKHGKKIFKFEILLYCNKENLIFYEQRTIDAYDFEKLYNIRKKAESQLGIKHTEKAKKNMSEGSKGKKHTKETKEKMSKDRSGKKNSMYGKKSAMKGKKHTIETKKKMSESQIGKKNHNYGKKASKETRIKLSKSHKGKHYGKKGSDNILSKEVFQINKNTLKIIKKWGSSSDAARGLKIDSSGISNVCRGRNKTCGGFIWVFTNSDLSKIKKIEKKIPKKGKQVYQIDINTNKIIKKWNKIVYAKKELKITDISRVCKGKRKTAGGFKWKYIK